MFAVKGVYDGNRVFVSESIPVKERCDVIVTFVSLPEIDRKKIAVRDKVAALNRLVGIASKNPISLEEAKAERLARQ